MPDQAHIEMHSNLATSHGDHPVRLRVSAVGSDLCGIGGSLSNQYVGLDTGRPECPRVQLFVGFSATSSVPAPIEEGCRMFGSGPIDGWRAGLLLRSKLPTKFVRLTFRCYILLDRCVQAAGMTALTEIPH